MPRRRTEGEIPDDRGADMADCLFGVEASIRDRETRGHLTE